ncbi:MAG: WXG100 family type VII secretion target [Candidatus Eremiobacterota bacterium]
MAHVEVDPEKLRDFAEKLKQFSGQVAAMDRAVGQALGRLGSTWRDPQFSAFRDRFRKAQKVLHEFDTQSRGMAADALQQAEAAERYRRMM